MFKATSSGCVRRLALFDVEGKMGIAGLGTYLEEIRKTLETVPLCKSLWAEVEQHLSNGHCSRASAVCTTIASVWPHLIENTSSRSSRKCSSRSICSHKKLVTEKCRTSKLDGWAHPITPPSKMTPERHVRALPSKIELSRSLRQTREMGEQRIKEFRARRSLCLKTPRKSPLAQMIEAHTGT